MKEEENRILGPTGIKIKEAGKEFAKTMKLKPVGFHVGKDKYHIWELYKQMLKKQGININPEGGEHMLNMAFKIDKALFNMANDIGVEPLDYAEERLETILKGLERLKHNEIEKLENQRDKTIKAEDKKLLIAIKGIAE